MDNIDKIYKKNICCIVVTFHPDKNLYKRIEAIRGQVDKLLIVDNYSSPSCISMIREISNKFDVEIIENQENLGIAKALNQGFSHFKKFKKYSWVLTLDQDSYCYPDLVSQLVKSYEECTFKNEIGIIGTNYKEKTTGRILHKILFHHRCWEEVKNLPTSGCLTSMQAFNKIGCFRNDLFIDYVDTEYCMRLRRNGYRVIISSKIGMTHPLGYYRKSKLYNFLLGKEMITNYPSIRHYYWTRNGIILIYENFLTETIWSIREIYYILIRRLAVIILFEDKKISKIRNILLGIWHAISSQRGIRK